ncbi:prepilin-type N-terminal cleavage/methylation domain-containing protein [Orbus mooreae]|uniref:prepilin-type N-terminal cleavage/methylation domain-containing protein n=1 Tax=Orbus mooreae TaxID=3074107 RepID=UPI00370D4015
MLSHGFSLFEMLIALVIATLIMGSIMNFYPQFHTTIMRIYLQNTLQEATEQALSGLIKDIHRAGFIANSPHLISHSAIEINAAGNCIVLRYDLTSSGQWRKFAYDPQQSDIFTYRYSKSSFDYQTGVEHCNSTATRWEKLFDPNEITVKRFKAVLNPNYVTLSITTALKHNPLIQYDVTYYVKKYN